MTRHMTFEGARDEARRRAQVFGKDYYVAEREGKVTGHDWLVVTPREYRRLRVMPWKLSVSFDGEQDHKFKQDPDTLAPYCFHCGASEIDHWE